MIYLKYKRLFRLFLGIYNFIIPIRQLIVTSKFLIRLLFNVKVPHDVSVDFDMTGILLRYSTSKEIKNKCKIFEMGVGTGSIISIFNAKRFGSSAFGSDISERRVNQSRYVAEMNNIKCDYIVSDLFTKIKQKFDYIIFNPPFVPSNIVNKLNLSNYNKGNRAKIYVPSESGLGEDGGVDGMNIINRFLVEAPNYLSPNGRVMLGVQGIYISREMITNALEFVPLKISFVYKLPFLTSAVYVLIKDN